MSKEAWISILTSSPDIITTKLKILIVNIVLLMMLLTMLLIPIWQ